VITTKGTHLDKRLWTLIYSALNRV